MEATLLHLIFNIATVLLTEVAEHLTQHPLQGVVAHLSTRLLSRLHRLIPIITYIKGGAIEVTGVLGGIAIVSTELRHIVLGTEDARHNNLVQWDALDLQGIEVSTTDVLQQD